MKKLLILLLFLMIFLSSCSLKPNQVSSERSSSSALSLLTSSQLLRKYKSYVLNGIIFDMPFSDVEAITGKLPAYNLSTTIQYSGYKYKNMVITTRGYSDNILRVDTIACINGQYLGLTVEKSTKEDADNIFGKPVSNSNGDRKYGDSTISSSNDNNGNYSSYEYFLITDNVKINIYTNNNVIIGIETSALVPQALTTAYLREKYKPYVLNKIIFDMPFPDVGAVTGKMPRYDFPGAVDEPSYQYKNMVITENGETDLGNVDMIYCISGEYLGLTVGKSTNEDSNKLFGTPNNEGNLALFDITSSQLSDDTIRKEYSSYEYLLKVDNVRITVYFHNNIVVGVEASAMTSDVRRAPTYE